MCFSLQLLWRSRCSYICDVSALMMLYSAVTLQPRIAFPAHRSFLLNCFDFSLSWLIQVRLFSNCVTEKSVLQPAFTISGSGRDQTWQTECSPHAVTTLPRSDWVCREYCGLIITLNRSASVHPFHFSRQSSIRRDNSSFLKEYKWRSYSLLIWRLLCVCVNNSEQRTSVTWRRADDESSSCSWLLLPPDKRDWDSGHWLILSLHWACGLPPWTIDGQTGHQSFLLRSVYNSWITKDGVGCNAVEKLSRHFADCITNMFSVPISCFLTAHVPNYKLNSMDTFC